MSIAVDCVYDASPVWAIWPFDPVHFVYLNMPEVMSPPLSLSVVYWRIVRGERIHGAMSKAVTAKVRDRLTWQFDTGRGTE